MTPAINAAKRAKVAHSVHRYDHDPAAEAYGEEAAQKLGIDPRRVLKTLLVDSGDGARGLLVGIVPVSAKLDLKAIAVAAGVKKVAMADPRLAERVTGYVVGGISPLGQKSRLRSFIDSSAQSFETICVSAGRRGLEIELAASDLRNLLSAEFAAIAR
jgi:Cys-tRNA(Pro)/Cys-tRNA(Cys) deacylase